MNATHDELREQHNTPRWVTQPQRDKTDVWRIDATDAAFAGVDLFALLSESEKAHADRFKHTEARRNFITGRACLRALLSRYIGTHSQDLVFALNANGKPSIPGSGVVFNLSHSEYLILIAISGANTVGVDVECHSTALHDRGIYPDVFTVDEQEILTHAGSTAAEETLFFHLWTAKEAILKADGRGLALPAKNFGIDPLHTGEQQVHLEDQPQPLAVISIPIDEGFSAALSYPAGPMHVNFLQFPPVWVNDVSVATSSRVQQRGR